MLFADIWEKRTISEVPKSDKLCFLSVSHQPGIVWTAYIYIYNISQ